MQPFTEPAQSAIADLAQRHGVSTGAVEALAQAMSWSGGTMAQFNHPDLGGMGQWTPGMMMIGDMFNSGLKGRVSALCAELSGLVRDGTLAPAAASAPDVSLSVPASGGNWWPSELGAPASAGAQNDMRYAYFPRPRRLAIQVGGRTTIYDSADHAISGVGQQQGSGQTLSFNSQHGLVRINDLRVVG